MGNKLSLKKEDNSHSSAIITDNNKNFEWLNDKKTIITYNEDEDYRLIDQHFIIKKAFNSLDENILSDVKRNNGELLILDSGCGNGTWCLDMSEKFPDITFYGIDKMDIFPKDIKPENCEFKQHDIFDYIKGNKKFFSLITQRFMAMYLTKEQWITLLKYYYDNLQPGGYIIFVESNFISSNMGKQTKEFAKQFMYLLRARKIDPYINDSLESLITSVGFTLKSNIYLPDKNYVSIPLFGESSIGKCYGENIIRSLKSMQSWFEKSLGIDECEFDNILNIIKEESEECKTFNNTYYYIAHKPN